MDVRCPGCKATVTVPDEATAPSCPRCQAPIPRSGLPEQPKDDLLAAVLAEVRQFEKLAAERPSVVEEAEAAPSPAPVDERRPGVFPKPSRTFYDRSVHWAPIAIATAIIATLIAGALAFYYVRNHIANQEAALALQRAESDLAPLRDSVRQADGLRQGQQFARAARMYQGILDRATVVVERLRSDTAGLGSGTMRARVQTVDAELAGYLRQAEEALKAPDVKFGSQGMIQLETGEWVTPEEKARLFAERMKSEGRELYEGKWLTAEEIHTLKGEVSYGGQWITKEEYARRIASAAKAPEAVAPPAPATPQPRPAAPAGGFQAADVRWVLDDFEKDVTLWKPVTWSDREANPCTVAVEEKDGTKQLAITFQGGKADKAAIMRPLNMDIKSRAKLSLDAVNATGGVLQVAIALDTDKYYEGRTNPFKANANLGITFDLRKDDFKSAEKHWVHAARVSRPEAARYLYILIYSNAPGKLYLDNVALLGAE